METTGEGPSGISSIGAARFSGPSFDAAKGVWTYSVTCPYLGGRNVVEVLPPSGYAEEPHRPRRVLYVLPVEPGIGGRFGDGLQAVRATGLLDDYGWIAVHPGFDITPFYCDHPTEPSRRHETYLRAALVPFIESRYATVPGREGRLLFGFSKSGHGALTLLLRDPARYGYALSWDAPLLYRGWKPAWAMDRAYGDEATWDHYRFPNSLRRYVEGAPGDAAGPGPAAGRGSEDGEGAAYLSDRARIALLGHDLFGTEPDGENEDAPHTETAHALLAEAGIPHYFDNTLTVAHHWDAGWVEPALAALRGLAPDP